ncbi:Plasmodium exported protein (PHISTa-like), putative [Plasmodium sp.]|nr:Plasmodium exported protein (PHISTa-like), putative [Plasmodium sp.]
MPKIKRVLRGSIQIYIDNGLNYDDGDLFHECIWHPNLYSLCGIVVSEEVEYTNDFFRLINDKNTYDGMLKFIYSFIYYFKTLKKELHEKQQEEMFVKITQILNKNY